MTEDIEKEIKEGMREYGKEEMRKYRKVKTYGRDGRLIEVLARKADFGKGKDKQAVMVDDVITAQFNYEKGIDDEKKRWLAYNKKLEAANERWREEECFKCSGFSERAKHFKKRITELEAEIKHLTFYKKKEKEKGD